MQGHALEDRRLRLVRLDAGPLLDVGDSESTTATLWREAGLKVLPGSYVARDVPGEPNPGAPYIRLALVHDDVTTEEALTRLSSVLPS